MNATRMFTSPAGTRIGQWIVVLLIVGTLAAATLLPAAAASSETGSIAKPPVVSPMPARPLPLEVSDLVRLVRHIIWSPRVFRVVGGVI